MTIFGSRTHQQFLSKYWQREPLFIRNSCCPLVPITPDELAGLACENDVESRLVIHDPETDQWCCEHGPFAEARFSKLPARGWTLLVQAVDQWLPEAESLKVSFNFLPSWRFDDIMISVSANAGGVGPHFDSYDVFLLQLSGTRCWRIGQRCDHSTALVEHPDLKLMSEFESLQTHDLEPGDMLYVPPGVAHWGTATSDDCVTCSIGFRSPAYTEIAHQAVALLATERTDPERFRDRPESLDDDPFLIPVGVEEQLQQAWLRMSADVISAALPEAFGKEITEPRYPDLVLADSVPTQSELRASWGESEGVDLDHNPASRLAYRVTATGAQLFVDGEAYRASVEFARGICHGRVAHPGDESELALLLALLRAGSVAIR